MIRHHKLLDSTKGEKYLDVMSEYHVMVVHFNKILSKLRNKLECYKNFCNTQM